MRFIVFSLLALCGLSTAFAQNGGRGGYHAGRTPTPISVGQPIAQSTQRPAARTPGYPVYSGTTTAPIVIPADDPNMPSRGTDAASVAAQFPIVYLYSVQTNPQYDVNFTGLDDLMLSNLSNEYLKNGGDVPALMAAFAQKLSAANLLRAQAAFGVEVDAAVGGYAGFDVQAQYFTAGTSAPLPMSHAQYVALGIGAYFPPEFSMTQYDLFLEYFAPAGATVTSALVRTAFFEVTVLKGTFDVSYWAGGKLVAVLDRIDPNINIELGNIIGSGVDDIVDLITMPSGTGYVDLPGFYDDSVPFDSAFDNFDWSGGSFFPDVAFDPG